LWILKLLILLLVAVIGAALTVVNPEPVRLDLYMVSFQSPLPLILVGALALGGLLGILASLGLILRIKRENLRLRRKAHLAEREISNLRILPIKDL
jgi:putative membrane protein